jgi:hypothetical protein
MPIAIQISFLRTLNVLRLMQASVKKENGQTVLVPLFLGQESVVGEVSLYNPSQSVGIRNRENDEQNFQNFSCDASTIMRLLLLLLLVGVDSD